MPKKIFNLFCIWMIMDFCMFSVSNSQDVGTQKKSFVSDSGESGVLLDTAEGRLFKTEYGINDNYVVTGEIVFLRSDPSIPAPEEAYDSAKCAEAFAYEASPYLYYGENIRGTVREGDSVVAVDMGRLKRGKGEPKSGYLPLGKLWREPALNPVETHRYMCILPEVPVRLIADENSRVVFRLLQGEVVDAIGKVTIGKVPWIKVVNGSGSMRCGYIKSDAVSALLPKKVDPAVLNENEIPVAIRDCGVKLSSEARSLLGKQGFFMEPTPPLENVGLDDMAERYKREEYGEQLFITTDLFLHATHVVMTRMMQDMEENKALPLMKSILGKSAGTAWNELKNGRGLSDDVMSALEYDAYFLSVGALLLGADLQIPEAAKGHIDTVVSGINNATGDLASIPGVMDLSKEDITQYLPRGHYEHTEGLRKYFRGMMWIGRGAFYLKESREITAFMLMPYIVSKAGAGDSILNLDKALTLLFGRQGSLTLELCRKVNKSICGTEVVVPAGLNGKVASKLERFRKESSALLPSFRIVSTATGTGLSKKEQLDLTACYKLLGQRFTWDAYMFNQLTSPCVGDSTNPRNLPSPYDVMNVLGSTAGGTLSMELFRQEKWSNYESQLEKVKTDFRNHREKGVTFYEDWLETLMTLYRPWKSRQKFCNTEAWGYKSLNTGLASWTELKHISLLYTEQSYAEAGGEGDDNLVAPPYNPPLARGYVEPNPECFEALTGTLSRLIVSLRTTGFMQDEFAGKLEKVKELASMAGTIAAKEVKGGYISRDEYRWIQWLPGQFNEYLLAHGESGPPEDPDFYKMALVVDVATDAVEKRVLEAATGVPQRIWVAVKDVSGGTRLTVGYVYSWYTFNDSKRWTDSEWKDVVYKGKAAGNVTIAEPYWYAKIRGPQVK